MACAFCLEKRKTEAVDCHICGKPHWFCFVCRRRKKLSSLKCLEASGKAPKVVVQKLVAKAKEHEKQKKKLVKGMKECKAKRRKAETYQAPLDAVVKPEALGPSDPLDIQNDPLKYVHIRAAEIWKSDEKLFNQTTAAVTIIECGEGEAAKRSVLLTSCVEGPNTHAALRRQAKLGEDLIDPDPIVHRVRNNLKPEDKKKGNPKPKDTVFVARLTSSNPVQDEGITDHPDYESAQKSMQGRNPKYTVTSLYPSADANETHAERRANRHAAAKGCRVIAQAPTIGVCDLCRASLGAEGLAKVPPDRQSSTAYNEYRRKTLYPTLYAK